MRRLLQAAAVVAAQAAAPSRGPRVNTHSLARSLASASNAHERAPTRPASVCVAAAAGCDEGSAFLPVIMPYCMRPMSNACMHATGSSGAEVIRCSSTPLAAAASIAVLHGLSRVAGFG